MSMYVDMLSSALDAWDMNLNGNELVEHALTSRVRMLATGLAHGASAYEALATELTYDRALIQLCGRLGIPAGVAAFHEPQKERDRLEQILASDRDLDLVAMSRARAKDAEEPIEPIAGSCSRL